MRIRAPVSLSQGNNLGLGQIPETWPHTAPFFRAPPRSTCQSKGCGTLIWNKTAHTLTKGRENMLELQKRVPRSTAMVAWRYSGCRPNSWPHYDYAKRQWRQFVFPLFLNAAGFYRYGYCWFNSSCSLDIFPSFFLCFACASLALYMSQLAVGDFFLHISSSTFDYFGVFTYKT